MTKKEEAALAALARTAKDLRGTVDNAESMIRSWARHKAKAGEIYVSLSDRREHYWHVGVHLPATTVQEMLIPILKRIRAEATEKLQQLSTGWCRPVADLKAK